MLLFTFYCFTFLLIFTCYSYVYNISLMHGMADTILLSDFKFRLVVDCLLHTQNNLSEETFHPPVIAKLQ